MNEQDYWIPTDSIMEEKLICVLVRMALLVLSTGLDDDDSAQQTEDDKEQVLESA